MNDYVSHLSEGPPREHLTACGEPWQVWQAPERYCDIPGVVVLPPHYEPRSHVDEIRACQACERTSVMSP